jgi:hypothetical protein
VKVVSEQWQYVPSLKKIGSFFSSVDVTDETKQHDSDSRTVTPVWDEEHINPMIQAAVDRERQGLPRCSSAGSMYQSARGSLGSGFKRTSMSENGDGKIHV